MTVTFEQLKASPEVIKQRANDAYDILFTETLKFMKTDEYKARKAQKNK